MMIGTTSRRDREHPRDVVARGPGAERDVEQDDVVGALRRGVERGFAVRNGRHAVALALEGTRQHLPQRAVVVDEKDVQRGGRLHGRRG